MVLAFSKLRSQISLSALFHLNGKPHHLLQRVNVFRFFFGWCGHDFNYLC